MGAHSSNQFKIIGQGICGSFLSYYFYKAGLNFVVYDEAKPYTASKVASGVINPVTGRRIVRTWMIDEIMPFVVTAYQEMERLLGTHFIRQCNILDFHPTPQMQQAFNERLPEEKEYLHLPNNPEQWRTFFNYPFSIGETNPCWLIDLHSLLTSWRNFLQQKNLLIEEKFEPANQTTINEEQQTTIFCDGVSGFTNPYFNLLPYAMNKGQALIVEINDLPKTNIFKQGISIVPWKENLWWVGSSYEWEFENDQPTDDFRNKIETQLNYFLKVPYKTVAHVASLRPANMERRPFVGFHPIHNNIGILNGMGTKGCSLAPYFANELTAYITQNKTINPSANVQRFKKILSR
jgi:glycine/D-amino acid oxidase-like deaminating enzyme